MSTISLVASQSSAGSPMLSMRAPMETKEAPADVTRRSRRLSGMMCVTASPDSCSLSMSCSRLRLKAAFSGRKASTSNISLSVSAPSSPCTFTRSRSPTGAENCTSVAASPSQRAAPPYAHVPQRRA
nr:MAG: hypothetical protein [Molluscum contagiosum virus]